MNSYPSRGRLYLGFILLVIAALCAGAAGAALIIRSAVGTLQASEPPASGVVLKPRVTQDLPESRGVVTLYKKHVGATLVDAALLPSEKIGTAVVVTSDGWLLTVSSLVGNASELLAVTGDRQVFAVDASKIIRDSATGLSFVRVLDASHLTVAELGDDAVLVAGQSLYAVSAAIIPTSLTMVRSLPVASRPDLVESSEHLARRLRTSDLDLPIGAPLMDSRSAVVGLINASGEAVPISFVSSVFKEVFKDGVVARPVAGIHYVSADLIAASQPRFARTGAVVAASAKARAVEKGSAAEIAGVREGDVIVAVERDRVDAVHTLSELLMEYAPGTEVLLTIQRSGVSKKIPLTLR